MQRSVSQWNDAANWYDENMGLTGDTLNSTIIRPVILELIGDLNGTTILDAGCGSGYLSAEFAKQAKKVVGTDFAPNFISLCNEKYKDSDNLTFALQDIEQPFSFEAASFDTVVCKMVLQYVHNILPFAQEAMRLLNDSGSLIVIVDHPFRAAYFNAQHQDETNNSIDYFSNEPKTKTGLWGKTELTWYARTTSYYIQTFTDCGFRLTEMREPLTQEDSPIPFSILALKFTK